MNERKDRPGEQRRWFGGTVVKNAGTLGKSTGSRGQRGKRRQKTGTTIATRWENKANKGVNDAQGFAKKKCPREKEAREREKRGQSRNNE